MVSLNKGSIMRVLGYMRVSTDQQSNGIEVQRVAIESYAKKLGIEVYKFFIDECVSGKTEKRDALGELFNEVQKNDLVIVQKRDRIARDLNLVITFENHMKKKGARIISTSGEGTDLENESSSFLLRRMIDIFSEHERIVISMRVKEAMRIKKGRNEFLGYIPYGKKLHPDGIHLEDDEEEQKILKMIKEFRDGFSESRIAEKLNNLKLWNRAKYWNRSSIQRIIKNNFPYEKKVQRTPCAIRKIIDN